MDIQAVKLDLINWITNLKDDSVIRKIRAIKNENGSDLIDTILKENRGIKQLLDKRLKEKTTDFMDADTVLKNLREEHGL